jgi:DNA-binding NtrC family response regulator
MYKILVCDDDKELCSIISQTLKLANYETSESYNGEEAFNKINIDNYDMVLLDVDMPVLNGLDALKKIKSYKEDIIIIMMTAYSNIKDAVQAVRDGAYNYIEKPIKQHEILDIVKRGLDAHKMIEEASFSAPRLTLGNEKKMIGESISMKKIFELIYKLSRFDTTVLVRGESGTGKELVARAIHFNSSRKDKRFVPVNCAAIPENLVESELFGHEKGAFTGAFERKIGKFQYADGGSIFLDEIAELPISMQVKLLRILQEKTFTPVGSNREIGINVRAIAATSRNLEEMIKAKTFREDLFYRLNVLPIFLPPLIERKDDISDLCQYFISKFNKIHGKKIKKMRGGALEIIKNYNWPGNIRELENVIERSYIIEEAEEITVDSLPQYLTEQTHSHAVQEFTDDNALDYSKMKESFEKNFIIEALSKFDGKINKTAEFAKIPKKTLLRKIEKYGIDKKQFKPE